VGGKRGGEGSAHSLTTKDAGQGKGEGGGRGTFIFIRTHREGEKKPNSPLNCYRRRKTFTHPLSLDQEEEKRARNSRSYKRRREGTRCLIHNFLIRGKKEGKPLTNNELGKE